MTSPAPTRCKCRKQAITGLRCSRCFVPICPDCSRPASVGMLCPECARGKPSHLYQIDPGRFALAIPVTLGVALVGGWLMATVRCIGFFGLFLGLIYGAAIGEVALRATGRKRGLSVEIMAGACALAGLFGGLAIQFLVESSMSAGPLASPGGEALDLSAHALSFLLNPWMYVTIGVAVFGAVSRVRTIG